MDSLASILKTVGAVAHSLLEPVNLLPPFESATKRSPSRDDDADDPDDMWLLQKRRRALCKHQPLTSATTSNKAQSTGATLTTDLPASALLSTKSSDSNEAQSTGATQTMDLPAPALLSTKCPENDIKNIPNAVRDELLGLLGMDKHSLHVGLALLTAGAKENPRRVGNSWGAGEKRSLLALDQLCSEIEAIRSQLIYWPRPDGPAARASRRAFDALATIRPNDIPPLDGVCGVLICQQFQQPAVVVQAICDASGTFRFVDVQQRPTTADGASAAAAAPLLQLPPMARDSFVVADEDGGSSARLGVHVMVPVRRTAGHRLSAQERCFNVALRRRTFIGRWAMRRLVETFAKLEPLVTPAEEATRTTTTDGDDQTDLKRFGVDGRRFVLATMVVHNLIMKHVQTDDKYDEYTSDEVDEESADCGIEIKSEPVDGGDGAVEVTLKEPTTDEQEDPGRKRRDELIKTM